MENDPTVSTESDDRVHESRRTWRDLWTSEDWLANWLGIAILAIFLGVASIDAISGDRLKSVLTKPDTWKQNPIQSVYWPSEDRNSLLGIATVLFGGAVGFGLGMVAMGRSLFPFVSAFVGLFLLGTIAYVLAEQELIKFYSLEYAVWALAIGLTISHTIGTPNWLRPGLCTEFYIKTGLVVYGSGILLNELLAFAGPGIGISWVVTPIVLISTYAFGQRVIRIPSKSLNMTLSADMSVCGVSAAIATAAACRAKREELSLAVGISLTFTAIMMVVMPLVIRAIGMDPVLGGAWIGGTIDATGAVAVAGGTLGEAGYKAAFTIKMIQNTLIGFIAFAVAVYWVSVVERDATRPAVGPGEIWHRLPKFILGFLLMSVAFTWIASQDRELVKRVGMLAKPARDWMFCLAFVSIGLETNFRQLASHLRGGKPVLLYVYGQSLNLVLTLAMAWLMFRVVFPDAGAVFLSP